VCPDDEDYDGTVRQRALSPVSVEKLQFASKQPKFEGYKMSRKSRKSFVGLPIAILFLRISRDGVFQQPRLIATVISMCLASIARIGLPGTELPAQVRFLNSFPFAPHSEDVALVAHTGVFSFGIPKTRHITKQAVPRGMVVRMRT
jgi:hypothetical protein